MIMAVVRRIPQEDRALRAGRWQTALGIELGGKTLGIIGLGKIGSKIAAFGRLLDMRVLACGLTLTPERAAAGGATMVPLDTLLRDSDVVSVNLRLSDKTRGFLGARHLALMKPTAFLVNSARGPIVDEAALVTALRERRIAGAALDVYDQEPLPANHPLMALDNAVLTPHSGFVTAETYASFFGGAVDQILAWLDGKTPPRALNPDAAARAEVPAAGGARQTRRMKLGLEGKVALVTGAGRDIGREIALTLAAEGAAVAVNYLKSKSAAEATAEEIRAAGGRAPRRRRRHRRLRGRAGDGRGREARVGRDRRAGEQRRPGPPEVLPADHARGMARADRRRALRRAQLLPRHRPGMVERKGGRIINIAGDSARVGQAQLAITAAARGGVLSLTRTLARELGRSGITVNAVAFGWVETGHTDPDFWAANREKILQAYAIKRLGRPGDIAPAVAFLASDLASWITGQTLSISGGYVMV
jgi:phosphoglycerate dehydrogenase-like enzyme